MICNETKRGIMQTENEVISVMSVMAIDVFVSCWGNLNLRYFFFLEHNVVVMNGRFRCRVCGFNGLEDNFWFCIKDIWSGEYFNHFYRILTFIKKIFLNISIKTLKRPPLKN